MLNVISSTAADAPLTAPTETPVNKIIYSPDKSEGLLGHLKDWLFHTSRNPGESTATPSLLSAKPEKTPYPGSSGASKSYDGQDVHKTGSSASVNRSSNAADRSTTHGKS